VAKQQSTAFERVFPRREFFRGPARAAVLWSWFSSLLFALFLFSLYLIAELLATGGTLRLNVEAQKEVADYTSTPPVIVSTPDGGDDVRADEVIFENHGLLPAVWLGRDRVWGPVLAPAYRQLRILRNNGDAFLTLILTASVLAFLWRVAVARARLLRFQAAQEVASRQRLAIHRQALRLGPGDIDGTEQKHVLELFTTDTDQLRNAVISRIEALAGSPFTLLLIALLALSISARLALLCAVPLAFCWFIAQREQQRLETQRVRAMVRSQSELRLLAESLQKTRLVRGYGMEDYAREQFEKYLKRFQQDDAVVGRHERLSNWGYRALIFALLALTGYLIGSKVLLAPSQLSFALGLFLVATLAWAWFPLQNLRRLGQEKQAVHQSAARIQRYLSLIPDVGQAVGAKFLQPLSRELEFVDVSYSTPTKKPLLDHISLKITAGQQVAIASTDPREALALTYLIPRFIEPQSGQVLIDGEDIAWVTLESLRAENLFVGGTDPFFTGTVLENIRGGSTDYTLNEVTEAAKLVHAHNFILKLPQGYETVIGEHGEQLDPGQSMRLSLARAVLRKPALMIIEEPSKPLDEDTKSLLDDAYLRIRQNRTLIFLPTRMSTLRRVEQIVFLHQGKIEAIGTHAELIQSSQLYRHWEYMRFNEYRRQFDVTPVG